MTSKIIQTEVGNVLSYKVIKDGYKTVSEDIEVVDSLPTRNTYNLTPSSEIHGEDLSYTIDTNHDYPPIIQFDPNIETADGEEIAISKYIYAPYGKDYLIMDFEQQEDNFIRVGNVRVDTDGTVSGFQLNGSCLFTPQIPFGTSDYELVIEFTPTDFTTEYMNFFYGTKDCYFCVGITNAISGKYYIHTNAGNGSSTWDSGTFGTTPLELNKTHLVKVVRTSGMRYVYISDDNGDTWSPEGSIADTRSYTITYFIGRGVTTNLYCGTIGLKNTYIKIDGELVFEPTWNKLARNYNCVGNPYIDNDIAYSFNSTSYLTPCFSPTTDTWEFTTKIYTGSQLTSHHNQILHNFTKNYAMAMTRQGVTGTPMSSYINSTWTQGTTSLSANTWYWFRFSCVNKVCKLYITRHTSQTVCPSASSMTLQCTVTASASFIGDWIGLSVNGSEYWGGEIDLKNTHFIEGDCTWNYEEVTGTNATVYGICRINQNNEVKNLDSGGYLTVPNSLCTIGNTFFYHFKTGAITSSWKRVYTCEVFDFLWVVNNSLQTWNTTADAAATLKSDITANTEYWVRVKTQVGKRSYAISMDGITYGSDIVVNTSYGDSLKTFYIGCDDTKTCNWNGIIYMSDFHVLNSDGEEIYSGVKPVGEFVPGILDSSIDDEGDPVTLNLYDVETNKRTVILNDDRDVTVSGKQFVQYDGEVDIPEHGLSLYDEDKHTWSKYRFATLSVDDEDTRLYVEGNIA